MMQIEINQEKCQSPRECLKCLQSCPEGVFMNYPRDARAPGRKAGNWVIVPVQKSLCTGCKVCEEVCPQKAVTVSVAA
jgi:Pyruvate/2-oxoacid:ferredoxin oxidoreductase delta subunit